MASIFRPNGYCWGVTHDPARRQVGYFCHSHPITLPMYFLYVLWFLAAFWVVFQLVLPFLTVLLSRLVGRERLAPAPSAAQHLPDYACIVTAYRNADIARPLVESLLAQRYDHLHVYLVADECPPDFDLGLTHPKVTVLRPDPPLRLKAKSLIFAMERWVRPHSHVAVFDADNLAHPHFFEEINRYVAAGHRCVQGQRTAKNLDNEFAAADSLGELYKNYIERYAPYLLGGSAVISGSGMVTEADLYRAYLADDDIRVGQHHWKRMLQEDKILQNFLLRRNERIAYARRAICYDEKVQSGEAVQTQRSRWLFSYFQNLPNTLGILWRGVLGGSWNQAFFGLVTLSLPMFLQLAAAVLLGLVGLWVQPWVTLALVVAVGVFGTTVLWVMRLSGAPVAVWRSLRALPTFVGRQAMGLLKMGNPNKNFKHTEHTQHVSIDEVLKRGGEE
jgi:cellulose synthase/poly-beta-1,6-N-acetylglucosamine synthase-like glycosyltransferase